MGRGLWVLLACAGVAMVGAVAVAVSLAVTLVPCVTAVVPPPTIRVCATPAWPAPWMPWIVLALAVGVAVALPAGGWRRLRRQVLGAHRHVRVLLAACVPTPDRVVRIADEVGLRSVEVIDVSQLVALTRGWMRPEVIVSTGLLERLSDDQLRAVLAHEAEHVRRRDPLKLAVSRTAMAALWPFPLAKDLAAHVELTAEVAADRAAVASVGLRPLAAALRAVLDGWADTPEAALSSIGGVAQRVEYLGIDQRPRFHPTRGSVVATVVSAVLMGAAVSVFVAALVRVGVWA